MIEYMFIVVRDAATVSSARRVAQVEPGLSVFKHCTRDLEWLLPNDVTEILIDAKGNASVLAPPQHRTPQVGDVWRWQHDLRVAFLVAGDGGGRVDGRFVENAESYEGPQSIEAHYFREAYAFDAAATEEARITALCGPPRPELPEPKRADGEQTATGPVYVAGFHADTDAFNEAVEKALSADSSRYVVSFDEATGYTVSVKHRDPSSSCARCGGPVLLQDCAREGGCKTPEERVDALGMRVVCVPPVLRRFYNRKTGLPEMVLMRESYWLAIGSTGDFSAEHPTREGAIARWRAAALAAERAK